MDLQSVGATCNATKMEFSMLFTSLPNEISIRNNGKEVYFIRNTPSGNCLFSYDLDEGSSRMVLSHDGQSKLSRAEQLLRERMRATGTGITYYKYFQSIDSLLVNAGSSCCLVPGGEDSTSGKSPQWFPCKEGAVDYKLCPEDTGLLGCISEGDIWLLSSGFDRMHQLTETHVKRPLKKLTAGQSSFILQEEFDRYTGYWWSPSLDENGMFRILYEEVDETGVGQVRTFNPGTQELDTYSYPRAGSANAVSCLKMITFGFVNGEIVNKTTKELPSLIAKYLSEWEYLVRIEWTNDGKNIWILLMNREQTKSQIVLINADAFGKDSEFPSPVVLWEETTTAWINYYNVEYVRFLPPTDAFSTRLLLTSETNGFPHLVLLEGNLPQQNLNDFQIIKPNLNWKFVTEGEWSVLRSEVWYDADENLVYFMGNKSSCLDSHLYVVRLNDDLPCSDPVQLTPSGQHHTITLDTKAKTFVTNCSNQSSPTTVSVFNIDTSSLKASHRVNLHNPHTLPSSYVPPTNFTTTTSSGEVLYGLVYPPANIEEGKKYPVVQYVYGGPAIQLITNAFSPTIIKIAQFTQNGFAVVMIDNRGSANRGRKFEAYIKGTMGSVEVDDQVSGLKAAANVAPYIDLDRVGMFGWSYGGYMSLLCLAKTSTYKVAVAGAPVTDWMWYDTGYTERYLGVPTDKDKESYIRSSVIPFAKDFPTNAGRLLIIHGMSDENVFFTHTSLLVDSLVQNRKPYQLQMYNGERHGLRTPTARAHCDATVLCFFLTNL